MTLPIRTLPMEERWDCHGCGICCWGTIIRLSDDDLQKIRDQGWDEHPDYRGLRTVERHGLGRKHYRLARRRDGHCVFLTSDGRCRIHQDRGADAKPLICRMYPFQLVPLEDFAYLTLKRSCPSAAADHGRELREHLSSVRRLAERGSMADKPTRPPMITRGHRRSWEDTFRVTGAIERLMLDAGYPLVRRLVHGLQFCKLLEMCRLQQFDSRSLGPLLTMLETSAVAETAEVFRKRRPPGRAVAGKFRQTAFEYIRLHPAFAVGKSWRERWRMLFSAIAFVRGKGPVFRHDPDRPQATFEALEGPLGHLGMEILGPVNKYFDTAAASKQYAVLDRRRWPIVDSFRALAMAFPIAMWMLRLYGTERPPTVDDVVQIVGTIERGQSYAPLCGRRHRQRVRGIARTGEMTRLVAWYAR